MSSAMHACYGVRHNRLKKHTQVGKCKYINTTNWKMQIHIHNKVVGVTLMDCYRISFMRYLIYSIAGCD